MSGRVWLDTGAGTAAPAPNAGNGREDAGEAGVRGVRVRILEGGVDAAPPTYTDENGNYSFTVPAGRPYFVQFGGGDTQYVFTQQLPGDPERDSDAVSSGQEGAGTTAAFFSVAAGGSLLNLDAGQSAWFDLDVDGNRQLGDAVDGAAGYLPGYEGSQAKLYNTATPQPQKMRLILEGFGTDPAVTPGGIARIEFRIIPGLVSRHSGYASNRTDPSLQPAHAADYSFIPNEDDLSFEITPTSVPVPGFPVGQIEATRAWVEIYAKDYGGAATIRVTVWSMDGAGVEIPTPSRVIDLKIPRDTDNDGIADKWELEMADRWMAQYGGRGVTTPAAAIGRGFTTAEALAFFHPDFDNELGDPDGYQRGRLGEQKDAGDAHTFLEEYRGYILDGGGLDGAGANGHAGGHIRLDPARKEVLLEVDHAAVLNNVPGGDVRGMLDGAAKVFSNADRGAGIYVYYLLDDRAENLPEAAVDEDTEHVVELARTRNPQLQSDFIHVLLIDRGVSKSFTPPGAPLSDTPAATYGRSEIHPVGSLPVVQRGVVFATTDATVRYNPTAYPNTLEAYSCVLAHEITHMLVHKRSADGFTAGEHTIDPNPADGPGGPLDAPCLMYVPASRANREFATVTFFPVVLTQISTREAEGLVF